MIIDDSYEYARGKLTAPAITLMVLSGISIGALLLALLLDLWLLIMIRSPESPTIVRMIWSLMMIVANIVTFVGALRMKNVRSFGLCRSACILALVPCLGPCFVLGIPCGIWGLIALNDPRVRAAF